MDSPTKAELEDAIELTPVVAKHEATNAPLRKPPPGQISLPEVPRHFVDSASSTPGTALNTPGLGPLTPTSSRLAFLLPSDSPSGAKNAIAALPDQDKGYAYVYLAAAACIDCATWGPSFSAGLLKLRWVELWPDPSQTFILSLAATLQTGLLFMFAILVSPVYSRYPEHRKLMQYSGVLLAFTGLLCSAFVSAPWQLIVCLGILHPLGASTVYCKHYRLSYSGLAKSLIGVVHSRSDLGAPLRMVQYQT